MTSDPSVSAKAERPTRVRYGVLAFCCTLAMITYLDRVCIGVSAPYLVAALGLSAVSDLRWANSAFNLAYAVFEVPTGWLGDVFGPKKTLIRIVVWWSLFTALTGLIGLQFWGLGLGLAALGIIRFMFGVGEAGAFPNITRALHNWFPFQERGMAQGLIFMGARLLGGLTPLIWLELVEKQGLPWRSAFWIFGGVGLAWCVVFAWWFRDHPAEKPHVNEAERDLITGGRTDTEAGHARVPWLRLLSSVNLWLLCLMYFCTAYGWYFNINYLPSYLQDCWKMEKNDRLAGLFMGGPFLLGAVGSLLGGFLTDGIIRMTGNRKWGRRLVGMMGQMLCATCFIACVLATNVYVFALAISLAAFFNDLTLAPCWATCQDIGKRYSAIVAGCMNTIGNLGGAAAVWSTGHILNFFLDRHALELGVAVQDMTASEKADAQLPGYYLNFACYGVIYLLSTFLWLRIDATKPVLPDEDLASPAESEE